jgi:hypothetical protein
LLKATVISFVEHQNRDAYGLICYLLYIGLLLGQFFDHQDRSFYENVKFFAGWQEIDYKFSIYLLQEIISQLTTLISLEDGNVNTTNQQG